MANSKRQQSNSKIRNLPAVKNPQTGRNVTIRRKGRRRNFRRRTGDYSIKDYSMIFIVLFLLAFGLVMLYSTSSYEAGIQFGDSAYYLKKQLFATSLGLVGLAAVSFIPYSFWKRASIVVYGISLLLVILIIPLGTEANGAKRWIYFGPISVQPAEVSKFAVLILTAALIEYVRPENLKDWKRCGIVMAPALVQGVAIWQITNNLSSAVIVVAIAAGMLFVATRDYWRFALLAGGVGLLAAGGVWFAVSHQGEDQNFRFKRVLAWLDPAKYSNDIGFQTLQALYGIGSGGILGKGLGQSMQKLGYIPEAQNDMIFSIICEELGLFGAISIIVMFVILCWRMMVIATNAYDLYGSMIAIGVMTHFAVQVILNIAVVTNTIPNTGVTLPFFSYGGTSVLFLLAEVGLAVNVSREIRFKEI